MSPKATLWLGLVAVTAGALLGSAQSAWADGPVNEGRGGPPYAKWKNGPPTDERFFPIGVWLQAPKNAERYKAAGFNLYVGLWKGPTAEQLDALYAAGMPVICDQNEVGLDERRRGLIIGWMHGDEPDNAQSRGKGKGYGPPVTPSQIVSVYEAMKRRDPTRPVLLNLGQGVAWDGWVGRGVRTNHPEDYAEYVKGGDLTSFDIYPVAHTKAEVQGKLWFVSEGVSRLRAWSRDRRVVWNCIECTSISSPHKATPQQVKAEVWLSLVHGSMGLIYFVHEFKPKFKEAALLADPTMLAAVTAINRQIRSLAPLLNSESLKDGAKAVSTNKAVPLRLMTKRDSKATYVFSVPLREGKTKARFKVKGLRSRATAEVLGEDRTISVKNGRFVDTFEPWDVHLYRIPGKARGRRSRKE